MKKYRLFTTSHSVVADAIRGKKMNCCEVCTSPYFFLCRPFCKYKDASVRVFLDDALGKEYDQTK